MSSYRGGHNPAAFVPVRKTAKCKRCGSEQVAWIQSKAGKWYLAEAYFVDGQIEAARFGFHKCPEVES